MLRKNSLEEMQAQADELAKIVNEVTELERKRKDLAAIANTRIWTLRIYLKKMQYFFNVPEFFEKDSDVDSDDEDAKQKVFEQTLQRTQFLEKVELQEMKSFVQTVQAIFLHIQALPENHLLINGDDIQEKIYEYQKGLTEMLVNQEKDKLWLEVTYSARKRKAEQTEEVSIISDQKNEHGKRPLTIDTFFPRKVAKVEEEKTEPHVVNSPGSPH